MPIPNQLNRAIQKFAKRDQKISRKFFPYDETKGDLKLYILARNGRGRKWDILGIVDAWGVEFNSFRNQPQFSVSTTRKDFGKDENESFPQILARSTHVAKNGELYATRRGDTVEAYNFDFSYKFYAEIEGNQTFLLSEAEMEGV